MSKVWIFNLILAIIVIAVVVSMNSKGSEVVTPPAPTPSVEPSIEIVEEGESLYGYTSVGESVPGESEMVHLTKAVTIKNPNDFPVKIDGVVNEVYDTSNSFISSEEIHGLDTLAPGEVIHMASTEFLGELHFREDYGSSQLKTKVTKSDGPGLTYTNLETIDTHYEFRDADPGNTVLEIDATFANHSSGNVDTSELAFVTYFYDHNGKLLGGDTETYITFNPQRIRPGEQKQISFEGSLLGREFSRNIGSIEVFAGCSSCIAR